MSRWHWRSEIPLSRAMAGARKCRIIWHLQSPLAGLCARVFVYADGEATIYVGSDPGGQMEFLSGSGQKGRIAIRDCMPWLRKAYALRLARAYADLET